MGDCSTEYRLLFFLTTCFRSLMPLRVVNRITSLHTTLTAILRSLTQLSSLLGVVLACMVVYAIVGMQLFMGTFGECSDELFPEGESRDGRLDINGSWIVEPCSKEFGREWVSSDFNYDNFGSAMLATYTLSVGGWGGIMQTAMDSTGIDRSPQWNSDSNFALFYFLGFFFLNNYLIGLFLGVVFDTYITVLSIEKEGMILTQEERRWVQFEAALRKIKPEKFFKVNHCAKVLQRVVESNYFKRFLEIELIFNFLLIAITHRNQADSITYVQSCGNLFISVSFALETALKVTAYGPIHYIRAEWFDGMVTAFAIIDMEVILMEGIGSQSNCRATQFIRALRVIRLLRIIKLIPGTEKYMKALFIALRGIGTIFCLFFIAIYIFANVGVAAFGPLYTDIDEHFHQHANFKSVGNCMQLLFVLITGDGWEDSVINQQGFLPERSHGFLMGYYVGFVGISQFLMLNLFVAIVVDANEVLDDDKKMHAMRCVPAFIHCWSKFDKQATGKISWSDLVLFIGELEEPLGVGDPHAVMEILFVTKFLKQCPDFQPTFQDVLINMMARMAYVECQTEKFKENMREFNALQSLKRVVRVKVGYMGEKKAMSQATLPSSGIEMTSRNASAGESPSLVSRLLPSMDFAFCNLNDRKDARNVFCTSEVRPGSGVCYSEREYGNVPVEADQRVAQALGYDDVNDDEASTIDLTEIDLLSPSQ